MTKISIYLFLYFLLEHCNIIVRGICELQHNHQWIYIMGIPMKKYYILLYITQHNQWHI